MSAAVASVHAAPVRPADRRAAPKIDVRPNDRIFITGAAGSGKTRLLSRTLIPRFAVHPPVILDPKGDFPPIGKMPRTNRYRRGEAQILHIPRRQQSPAVWEEIIDRILDHGNQTIVVDDIYAINGGSPYPRPNLLWAITGGRSIGCPVYTGCQRPARIPVSVLTEAEHYFVFALRREEDRKTIVANTSPKFGPWIERLGEHDWAYYRAVPPRRIVVWRY